MARTAITGAVNVVRYALMTKKEFLEAGVKNQNYFVEEFEKNKDTKLYRNALKLHAEFGADRRVKMHAIRIMRAKQ